jgi:hypothetical protein
MTILVKQNNSVWEKWNGESNLTLSKVLQLIQQGIWTESDYSPLGLKIAEPFTVPEGKQIDGSE